MTLEPNDDIRSNVERVLSEVIPIAEALGDTVPIPDLLADLHLRAACSFTGIEGERRYISWRLANLAEIESHRQILVDELAPEVADVDRLLVELVPLELDPEEVLGEVLLGGRFINPNQLLRMAILPDGRDPEKSSSVTLSDILKNCPDEIAR
jgi:hypothetical protein